MGRFRYGEPNAYAIGNKGFIGKLPLAAVTTTESIITFSSGNILAPTYDTTGPGIAPPIVTLVPPHPAAQDYSQDSGGALTAGDANHILYAVAVLDLPPAVLSLNVIGTTYVQTDIASVSFLGADAVQYNLGMSDFFLQRTDIADPTLQYSLWQWDGQVAATAFQDGIQTTLHIHATFAFGN